MIFPYLSIPFVTWLYLLLLYGYAQKVERCPVFYRFDLKGCLDGYASSYGKKHKPAKQSVQKNKGKI